MEAMLQPTARAPRVSSDQAVHLNIDTAAAPPNSLVGNGRVIVAIHIGGRLQVVDDAQDRQPNPAASIMPRNQPAEQGRQCRSIGARHDRRVWPTLVAAIRMRPLPPPLKMLYLTEPMASWDRSMA
jgi:hypothetical protein